MLGAAMARFSKPERSLRTFSTKKCFEEKPKDTFCMEESEDEAYDLDE